MGYLDLIEKPEAGFDSKAAERDSLIDLKKPIVPQPVLVSYGQDWAGQPLCVLGGGDYSAITGIGKSKKSFVKSALVAIYQGSKNEVWPGWKSHRDKGKLIIDIDTEQSDYHAQRAFRRVATMAGWEDPLYRPYALRKYTPAERMNVVEEIVDRYGSKIGLMSIDGYADLIKDPNDNIESSELVQKLMTWTDKYQFHIMGILHTNPDGLKMRGHLGSDVSRKASTAIKVTANQDNLSQSRVEHVLARDEAFMPFEIEIRQGIPYIV